MMDQVIEDILVQLDNELTDVPAINGIKMSNELYNELLKRGKLNPTEIDMILWKWMAPAYSGHPVYHDMSLVGLEYAVGNKSA